MNTKLVATILLSVASSVPIATQASVVPHSGVLQIYAGSNAQGACAILADHRMSCWGFGGGFVETQLVNGERVQSVAIGSDATCVVLVDGSVWCAGSNDFGQLGNGTTGTSTSTFGPAKYLTSGVSSVVAGTHHMCALKNDTSVWCWGSNSAGQIGNYGVPFGSSFNVPVQVVVHDASSGTTDQLTNVTSISAGSNFTCATLREADESYSGACWGDGYFGQLGNGQTKTVWNSPQTLTIDGDPTHKLGITSASITSGNVHACVLVPNASPYSVACWGNDSYGQSSNGGDVFGPLPEAVVYSDGTALTGVSAISAGYITTCGILADKTALCWGDDTYGQVGNYELGYGEADSPVAVKNADGSTLGNVEQIVLGQYFSCALTSDRRVICWGDNSKYQLGFGQPHGPKDIPGEAPVDGPIFYDGLED